MKKTRKCPESHLDKMSPGEFKKPDLPFLTDVYGNLIGNEPEVVVPEKKPVVKKDWRKHAGAALLADLAMGGGALNGGEK